MIKDSDGRMYFGFWNDMPYRTKSDKFEDFTGYKNTVSKNDIINYMDSLSPALACAFSKDMFTGAVFNAGIYWDGPFTFPVDFLRYYKTQDIGIPYEYEEYLKGILKTSK